MQRILFLFLAGWLFTAAPAHGQDTAYTRVITQRADKIVAALGLTDAAKTTQVRDIIVEQYRNLNDIHTARDTEVRAAKEQLKEDKQALDARIKVIEAEREQQLQPLHSAYLSKLAAGLSKEQVDKVKDGMTYGVLPLTYRVYNDMLPNLTEAQKTQIMAWLVEAREHAMDAGSSDKKHWWFGKYKGRINNYLAAAGINMKQAEQDWKKRREAGAK
jgi:hypothetical protein